MKFKIINDLAIFLDNIVSEKYLSKLQEFLLSGAIFTEASKVLAILIIFILLGEIVFPDFLRQLSSMLQVGLSFENAMEDMSQYGEGPLYDEMS